MTFNKEFKLGIFVTVIIAVSIFVINYLRGADLFGREIRIEGRFYDVQTLVESAPVQIRGYSAGKVKSVEYDPDHDDFRVICEVDKRFRIPVDSRMVLYSTSLMGGKGIRIECGQSPEMVSSGDVLETGADQNMFASIYSEMSGLIGNVNYAIDTLKTVLANVNQVLGESNRKNLEASFAHLRTTLANAASLSESLGGKSEEISRMVGDLSSLSGKLDPIVVSASKSVSHLESITAALDDADIKGTVENVKRTAGNVSDAVEKISQPLDSLLNDADSLIKSITENPKKYIKITVF